MDQRCFPSWDISEHNGPPKATISVRNLQTSSICAKDAWGRTGTDKPILVTSTVSLHDYFQSASSVDEVDNSTIHYGILSKGILAAIDGHFTRAVNPSGDVSSLELSLLLDHIMLQLMGFELDGARVMRPVTPILMPAKVQSVYLQIMLPKSSLSGSGVSLTATTHYHRSLHTMVPRPPVPHSLVLRLHDLRISTLIGVHPYERLNKQMVIANVEIEQWDLRNDEYNELEQIVVRVCFPLPIHVSSMFLLGRCLSPSYNIHLKNKS